MEEKIKHYSNGEITVVWEAAKCQYSGVCFTNLPAVFKPSEKPGSGQTEPLQLKLLILLPNVRRAL